MVHTGADLLRVECRHHRMSEEIALQLWPLRVALPSKHLIPLSFSPTIDDGVEEPMSAKEFK